MINRRFIHLQRRIVRSERHDTIRFLFLLALAFVHLPPRGFIAYLSVKRRQRQKRSATPAIGLWGGRTVFLRDNDTDLSIFEQVLLLGDCALPWKVKDIRCIIDAGAHIGSSSLFYASQYPGARILAIEPDAGNFRQLVKNTAGHPTITPIQAAVFHRSTNVAIVNPGDLPWGFQVEPVTAEKGEVAPTVHARTLPEFMEIAGFSGIDLLKMDIEGAERDIFAAPTETWLPRVRFLVVELHDQIKPGCSEKFNEAVGTIPHRIERQMQNTVWHNLAYSSTPCPPPVL